MGVTTPVFVDSSDAKLWKRLDEIEAGLSSKNSKKSAQRLMAEIDTACKKNVVVSSVNLGRMMRLASACGFDDLQNVLLKLIEKCQLSDCMPQLIAAGILISNGDAETAGTVLDRITIISDMAQWYYERGQVAADVGDAAAALDYYHRSHSMDHSFLPVYDLLDNLEPKYGWQFFKNIILLRNEIPAKPYGQNLPSCAAEELYGVYWEWHKGNRTGAIETLHKMTEYVSGDQDFILASARMARERGDLEESIAEYRRIIGVPGESFSVSIELARVYISSGAASDALDLCNELEKACGNDRRLMETEMQALAADKDTAGLRTYADRFLYSENADLDAYVFTIGVMTKLSMHAEVSSLIEKLNARCPDADIVYLLSAKNEFESERFQSALSSINKAVKRMPDDMECRCLRARIFLAMGNTRKATADVDTVIAREPSNTVAMKIKREIMQADGNNEGAYRLCQEITKSDPADSEALYDSAVLLQQMEMEDKALAAYRDALNIRTDLNLFLKIMGSLVESGKYQMAIKIAQEYDDIYGKSVDTWIYKGNAEYAIGDYYNASESYAAAGAIEPANPTIWHSKGMADEMAENYDEAESAFDKAVLLDLDNQDYWISKAAVQEKKGDYPGAVESLNRVISDHPENVYALVRKAMVLVRTSRCSEALFFLNLALTIDQGNMAIQRMKRDIYVHDNDYDETINVCNSILARSPDDERTVISLSNAYAAKSNFEQAMWALDRSGLDTMPVMKAKLDIFERSGNSSEVIRIAKAILLKEEGDRDVKLALADALAKQGEVDAANKLYDEIQTSNPQDAAVSVRKARMSAGAGDQTTAIKMLRAALDKEPRNVDTLLEMSAMLVTADKNSEAIPYIDRAIAADPTSSRPYIAKARVLMDMHDDAAAQAALTSALHVTPTTDPEIWLLMGDVQDRMGDSAHALLSYDSAAKSGLDTADIYYKRGHVQEVLKMSDAAMNSYTLASLKDRKDARPLERMAAIQLEAGREVVAVKYLDEAISLDPAFKEAVLARAKIFAAHNDIIGIRRLLAQYKQVDSPDGECLSKLMVMSGSVEDNVQLNADDEEQSSDTAPAANDAVIPAPVPSAVGVSETAVETSGENNGNNVEGAFKDNSASIKDMALAMLKCANDEDKALDDPDVIGRSGVPKDSVSGVLAYLSDISEYDTIVPGKGDFDRMEELSFNVISKGSISDIESEPLISLTSAYFTSGASGIEEAKTLIAYIFKAISDDFEPMAFSPAVTKAVNDLAEMSGDIDVYGIMMKYRMGVYTARTVKLLAVNKSDSVAVHV
jgi:tetratricopeptide (TPR) repeat protein